MSQQETGVLMISAFNILPTGVNCSIQAKQSQMINGSNWSHLYECFDYISYSPVCA